MQGCVHSALHISAGRRAPSTSTNLDEPVTGEQHSPPSPEGHRSCQPSARGAHLFVISVQVTCSHVVLHNDGIYNVPVCTTAPHLPWHVPLHAATVAPPMIQQPRYRNCFLGAVWKRVTLGKSPRSLFPPLWASLPFPCRETQQGLSQPLLSSPWRANAELGTHIAQAASFSPHLHDTSWPKLVNKYEETIHELH